MKNKGQWFLLSAVIASATFLTISIMFKGYFSMDSSRIANIDDDFFFGNVVKELNSSMKYSSDPDEVRKDVEDFAEYAKEKALERGCFLVIRNTSAISPAGTNFIISMASEDMNITKAVRLP
jgi:hypothetical protein